MGSFFFQNGEISLGSFYRSDVLNIFSDASITGKPGNQTGCYGVVGVVKDDIIDSTYRFSTHTTSNESEVKGLRAAIDMAMKYAGKFACINIFCDSQISVFGLREYIYKWRYNPKDGRLYSSLGKPVVNQDIFVECRLMLDEICTKTGTIVALYHQSGHIDNRYDDLKKAAYTFGRSNNFVGNIDLNFVRYISTYNNFVDHNSRSLLRRTNTRGLEIIDPISFHHEGPFKK